MQFGLTVLIAIAFGIAAKNRGFEGFKWGSGAATLIFGGQAVIALYQQAAGGSAFVTWEWTFFVTIALSLYLWNKSSRKSTDQPREKNIDIRSEGTTLPFPVIVPPTASSTIGSRPFPEQKSPESVAMAQVRQQMSLGDTPRPPTEKVTVTRRIVSSLLLAALVIGVTIGGIDLYIAQKKKIANGGMSSSDSVRAVEQQTQSNINSGYIVPATKVDAGTLATATSTKRPIGMPLLSWKDEGFGFSQRTRVFFQNDNFGKITTIRVDQLAVI